MNERGLIVGDAYYVGVGAAASAPRMQVGRPSTVLSLSLEQAFRGPMYKTTGTTHLMLYV